MNNVSKMSCNTSLESTEYIDIGDIFRYKKVPGVWALLGQREKGWEWVTVAATEDIGDEISEDVLFMMKDISKRGTERKYTNYWEEELFKFRIYNIKALTTKNAYYLARRKALWAHISSVYSNFCFACLVKNELDKKVRFSKEKYIATKTRAIYWNDLDKSRKEIEYRELDEIIDGINKKLNIC